jgi:serine-type D-Ala-D-Ala carboxypeptidase/endopeptidase (penicillin-binding protein 4)
MQKSVLFAKILSLGFLLFSCPSFSQNPSLEKLKTGIELLKSDPELTNGSWGLSVQDISTKKILAEYNSNLTLIPASTLKIITTGAALSILGKDFRYQTNIEYDGFVDANGVLHGNIFIKGSGDPTLDSYLIKDSTSKTVIEEFSKAIRGKGIKYIEGAVISDASSFEDQTVPPGWIWEDIGNYFGAGSWGLNFMDNKYTVYFNSGASEGDSTYIKNVFPEIPGLQLVNKVTSGGKGDNAFIFGAPYSDFHSINGTIPLNRKNFDVEGAMPDPSLFCAQALYRSLQNSGIKIDLPATTVRLMSIEKKKVNSARQILYSHFSPTLDKIIYFTNLKSNNLYAETILKTIALKLKGKGTLEEGKEAVLNFWASKGINIRGLFLADGSGLSRSDGVTTKQFTDILTWMYTQPEFISFYNSLPVVGRSGSVTSMCKGTCAEGNMRAKSGYISRVRSYAGYVKDKSGRTLSFSIIANNFTCSVSTMKKKIEKLMVMIAELE